jgi:hypothetical protein
MKTCLLLFLLVNASALGQGTIEFRTVITQGNALPPSTGTPTTREGFSGGGTYTLDGDRRFNGDAWFPSTVFVIRTTAVQIFESSDAAVLGTPRYAFTLGGYAIPEPPDPGGGFFKLSIQITPADQAALLAGHWWVNVADLDYPISSLRGQITLVPEPETWTLLAIGSLAVLLFRRRCDWAKVCSR